MVQSDGDAVYHYVRWNIRRFLLFLIAIVIIIKADYSLSWVTGVSAFIPASNLPPTQCRVSLLLCPDLSRINITLRRRLPRVSENNLLVRQKKSRIVAWNKSKGRDSADDPNDSENPEKKTQNDDEAGFQRVDKKGAKWNLPQQQERTWEKSTKKNNTNSNFLSLLSNPYKAGKQLRQTLDSVLKPPISPEQRAIYYLDDRFLENENTAKADISEGALAFAKRNPLFDQISKIRRGPMDNEEQLDYIPEVLVVGATGAIGRLVVKRLLLSGRFRVRVLVRDLYSKTLNMLGTGVTYCQGDLKNIESLEYAVTDVDKIIFCAGPPSRDEDDFGNKFMDFATENLGDSMGEDEKRQKKTEGDNGNSYGVDLDRLSDTMETRAKLAHLVDEVGMQNIVRAYQNVRHADYGTSQAAKRSLFKFQDREEDFNLFSIDSFEESQSVAAVAPPVDVVSNPLMVDSYISKDAVPKGSRRSIVKTQITWMKNKFNHGVFVGRLPVSGNGIGAEASIVSSRLRSRDDPDKGTDLSNGFSGFVCRVCADGKTYQAFIRTTEYDTLGIEYVCKFVTEAKQSGDGNKSSNKFQTIRLPFSKFRPVVRQRKLQREVEPYSNLTPFGGEDVKQIGFRIDSMDNILPDTKTKDTRKKWVNFYLALSYIKVYRAQPEPEFIYVSDARIPPVIKYGMVRHDLKRIISDEKVEGQALFDDNEVQSILRNPKKRSGEELYYKYKGEEILKNSGLQYAIVRVPPLNESPSGEFSTIALRQSNKNLTAVSRSEVAAVCVDALLQPHARNVCFYLTKAKPVTQRIDEKISTQFESLIPDL